jgi:hypothetical protein
VKKVGVTLRRGGEYGVKLYFDSCNGKWLMDDQLSCWCLVALEYNKVLGKIIHIIII